MPKNSSWKLVNPYRHIHHLQFIFSCSQWCDDGHKAGVNMLEMISKTGAQWRPQIYLKESVMGKSHKQVVCLIVQQQLIDRTASWFLRIWILLSWEAQTWQPLASDFPSSHSFRSAYFSLRSPLQATTRAPPGLTKPRGPPMRERGVPGLGIRSRTLVRRTQPKHPRSGCKEHGSICRNFTLVRTFWGTSEDTETASLKSPVVFKQQRKRP